MPVPSKYAADGPTATLSALADSFRSECRLLEELMSVMRRQRSAVAADDLQTVEDSVYATHRVLHTLNEARRRRRSLNRMLGESDDLPIRALDHVLGARMTGELREARDELERIAHELAEEVDVNRRVLREALASGDDYVRSLYGGEPSGYPLSVQPAERGRSGGLLLDRKA